MNIITKFQIGDTAFRLHHNKVQEVDIEHFQINVKPSPLGAKVGADVVEICYTLTYTGQGHRDSDNYEYEGSLFATKMLLLASL